MRVIKNIVRGVVAVAVVWQAAVWLLAPPRFMLPGPLDVLSVFAVRYDFLFAETVTTVVEILLGLFFGTVSGVLTALAVVALPRFGLLAWPFVLVIQALPIFAIAPLLVLWFGFGLASKVVMATLIIFFPVTSAFADGLRRTEQDLLDATALAGATHWQTLWHIRMPLGLPGFVSGLRVAAPLAPLGAVIGEWVGASGGLGFVMLQANARMQTDIVFAALVILSVLTLVLRYLADELAGLLVPWARET